MNAPNVQKWFCKKKKKPCYTGLIFIIKADKKKKTYSVDFLQKCVLGLFFCRNDHVGFSIFEVTAAWTGCSGLNIAFWRASYEAGGQPVRDLLVKSLQVRRGQGVTMWTVPPRTINRQEEMPRSGAGWAAAKGQGPLIKWLFPAIPQWPVDAERQEDAWRRSPFTGG